MRSFRTAAVIAASMFSAGGASAQGLPSWTGVYMGLSGGYTVSGNGRSSRLSPNDDASGTLFPGSPFSNSTALPAANFNVHGGIFGVQAGWNWQFAPRFVAGFETDFNFTDVSGKGSSANQFDDNISLIPFLQTTSERLRSVGTVRGRFGYLITENVLLYGTGGFAYGTVQQDTTFAQLSPTTFSIAVFGNGFRCVGTTACFSASRTDTEFGYTAGGGAEWKLWSALSLKVEYTYVNLGRRPNYVIAATSPIGTGSSITVNNSGDLEYQFVRAGFNWAF